MRTVEHDRELLTEILNSNELLHGRMLAHDIVDMLQMIGNEGSAQRWQSSRYTEEQARAAVKAYVGWLTRVADEAR